MSGGGGRGAEPEVDLGSEEDQTEAAEQLGGDHPGLATADGGEVEAVDERSPEEFEGKGQGDDGEEGLGTVAGVALLEDEGHGHGEAHRDALEQVQEQQHEDVHVVALEGRGSGGGRGGGGGGGGETIGRIRGRGGGG